MNSQLQVSVNKSSQISLATKYFFIFSLGDIPDLERWSDRIIETIDRGHAVKADGTRESLWTRKQKSK
jgi:hypothetical protein